MPSRTWRFSTEPYRDFDLVIDTGQGVVLLKEWFDPGKDPVVSRFRLNDFEYAQIPDHAGRQQLIQDIATFLECEGR